MKKNIAVQKAYLWVCMEFAGCGIGWCGSDWVGAVPDQVGALLVRYNLWSPASVVLAYIHNVERTTIFVGGLKWTT